MDLEKFLRLVPNYLGLHRVLILSVANVLIFGWGPLELDRVPRR